MRKIAIVLITFFVASIAAAQTPAPEYEIYAIKYATIRAFPLKSLLKDADANKAVDIAMMFWLIRAPHKNILVDAGFYRQNLFANWAIADYSRPDDALRKFGVKPADVTDIILTHGHWDHADGADLFPNATYWMQKEEFRYYTGDAWQLGGRPGGIEPEDSIFWVAANTKGKMRLIDGDKEIFPGIRVYIGGRHTFASQYVTVETKNGPVVLASDNVYLYENLDKHLPIAQTWDEKSNLAAQDKMKTLVKDQRFIIPGHDPQVMTRFPKVADNVVKIE